MNLLISGVDISTIAIWLEEIPRHMDDKDCSFFGRSSALVRKTSGRDPQSLNIGGCKAAA